MTTPSTEPTPAPRPSTRPSPTTLAVSSSPTGPSLPPVATLPPTMSAVPAASPPPAPGALATPAAPPVVAQKRALAADDEGGATDIMKRDQDPALAAVIAKVTDIKVVETVEGTKVEMKVERYKGPEPLSRKILALALAGVILVAFSRFAAGWLGYGMVIVGFACVIFALVRLFPRLRLLETSFDGVLEVANEAKAASADDKRALTEERAAAQSASEAAVTDGKTKDAEIERLQGLVDNSVPKAVAEELVRRDPTNVAKCRPTDVREINDDGTLVEVDIYEPVYSSECKVFFHLKHDGESAVTQCWLKRGKRYSFDGLIVSVPADDTPVLVVRRNMNAAKVTPCPMNKSTMIAKIGDVFVTVGPKAAASRMFSPSAGVSTLFDAAELEAEALTTASPISVILQAVRSHAASPKDAAAKKG